MPRVTFHQQDGSRQDVAAPVGISLMEAARQHNVPGIIALCGGACACATCHVYVAPAWFAKLPPRGEMEEGMLETAWEPGANSRLGCQVEITADLEGLEVTVPKTQAE